MWGFLGGPHGGLGQFQKYFFESTSVTYQLLFWKYSNILLFLIRPHSSFFLAFVNPFGLFLHFGVATIVQGTIVQGAIVQRDVCPRGLLSKETFVQGLFVQRTFVQGDFCPRRLLSKETIFQGRLLSKEDYCPRRHLSKETIV